MSEIKSKVKNLKEKLKSLQTECSHPLKSLIVSRSEKTTWSGDSWGGGDTTILTFKVICQEKY